MNKVLNLEQAIKISEDLRNQGKTIVLAGGVFDILHIGHIRFLKQAKQHGDVLFILLENDQAVKRLKGDDRPYNNQHDRAEILSELKSTDYIICLPTLATNKQYDWIVISLKPAIIAITKNDPALVHKKRQAEKVKARLVEVIDRLPASTSKLAKLLEKNTL